MGNSSPPVVTSRSPSLGGSSRLHRQLGRMVSPLLPSASTSAPFHFPLLCRESPDLSVALSLDGQGDMSTTSLIFPEFISCMGNRIHLLLCQDKCFLSECLPDIPNCVSFPSQYGMSDLLYIDTWENVDCLFAIDPSLLWSSPVIWAKGQGWYAFKGLY